MNISKSKLREILCEIISENHSHSQKDLCDEILLEKHFAPERLQERRRLFGRELPRPKSSGDVPPALRRRPGLEWRVAFGWRSLFGSPAGHSWIMLFRPGESPITLSGKTGVAYTFSQIGKALWGGRNDVTDSTFYEKYKAFKKGEIGEEEFNSASEALDWKMLLGLKGWDSDNPAAAEESRDIPPPRGVSESDFQEILLAAFEGYNGAAPYDPLPEMSDNASDRNSNSFAFSLLRSAFKGALPPGIRTDTLKYPGSTQRISSIIQAGERKRKQLADLRARVGSVDVEFDETEDDEYYGGDDDDVVDDGEEEEEEEAGVGEGIKMNRDNLRDIIIEVLNEGDVIDLSKYRQQDDPEQEWFDLFDEEELEKYKARGRLRQQTQRYRGQESRDDETFEEYLGGVESGKIIDLFQDDDPLHEDKTSTGMYGDPSGLQVPYGDDIDEDGSSDDDDLDEDAADDARNRDLDLQLKLRSDTAAVNKPGSTALQRQAVRGDQAALSQADDGIDF